MVDASFINDKERPPYQQPAKRKSGCQAGYCTLTSLTDAQGVANKTTPALEDTERRLETQPHQHRNPPDNYNNKRQCINTMCKNFIKPVKSIPILTPYTHKQIT